MDSRVGARLQKYFVLVVASAGILAAGALAGCKGSAEREQVLPPSAHEVPVYFPSEVSAAILPSAELFNSSRRRAADGRLISIQPLSSDGTRPISRIKDSSAQGAAIWLASSSLAIDALRSELLGTDRTVDACASMGYSDLGVAARESDDFTIEHYRATGLFEQFISPSSAPDPARIPLIISGLPSSSTSGLAVFTMTSASALKVRVAALSPELLASSLSALIGSQARVTRYFASDTDMLRWLSAQPGGQPALALTSRQQVLAHNSSSPQQPLAFVRATVPELSLDYPLCLIRDKSISPSLAEALHAAHQHLATQGLSARMASMFGFSTSADQKPQPVVPLPGSELKLLALWPQARKPSITAFVIDTSSEVAAGVTATIQRELHHLSARKELAGDSLILIATSTRAEIVSKPSAEAALFREALKSLRPSGAFALRDGISMAMNLVNDAPARERRGAVVVIASGPDTASAASLSALRARASSEISRRGVALYVVGLLQPDPEHNNGYINDLRYLAADLGGTFVGVMPAELPGVMQAIFQEIE